MGELLELAQEQHQSQRWPSGDEERRDITQSRRLTEISMYWISKHVE